MGFYLWCVNIGYGCQLVGGVLVVVVLYFGLYDFCGGLFVYFVEIVFGGQCVECVLFVEGVVGIYFYCINGVGVYWLGVGEYGMICVWGFVIYVFDVILLMLCYVIFIGNICGVSILQVCF